MTDLLWARSAPPLFSHATILLLTVVSMVTIRFGETYPVRSLRYTPYTTDEDPETAAAMRVLRQMSEELLTVAPPSPQRTPAALANPQPGGAGLARRSWWYPEMPPPQAKKRENFASYNWNSFGLRYGK